MKVDAHYYGVLGFARVSGFEKDTAQKIAYASQFVDDAKINYLTVRGDLPDGITSDRVNEKNCFFNMATCHTYTRIKTFNYSAMIHNTSAFHFVPGARGPSFVRKMRCREKSPVCEKIMDAVLQKNDPIFLGLVLHPFADTFSHQGFSGLLSKVNDIDDCKILNKSGRGLDQLLLSAREVRDGFYKMMDFVMPAYGHGQAMGFPDLPYLKWSYDYDYTDEFAELYQSSGVIDNPRRFCTAFEEIRGYLQSYLQKYPKYRDSKVVGKGFEPLFKALVAKKSDKGRIRNWRKVLVENGLFEQGDPALKYDKDLWLREAFDDFDRKRFHHRQVIGAKLAPGFKDSCWYRFYRAVKWYKELFFETCTAHGLTIQR
jgi:hypothetical protein